MDTKYFREIFTLNATGEGKDKLNYQGLQDIFQMVGFAPNEK